MKVPELKSQQAHALASDADKGPPQYDLPPPSTAGAIDSKKAEDLQKAEAKSAEEEDEHFWKIVGWRPRFGDGVPEDVDMSTNISDQQTWLEERINDKFFGGEFQQQHPDN
jgi:hypothetical protein